MNQTITNWAGNIPFRAQRFEAPTSVEELQELVAGSRSLRVLGTGHSFNAIADTAGLQVSTKRLPSVLDIDTEAGTVTLSSGSRFGQITNALHGAGFALHNLGSLPHISIAGACATGTHGSGNGNGTIPSAVRAVEYISASGERVWTHRGDDLFTGSVVTLGALGVVTALTLDLVPAFDVQQWVYEGLPLTTLLSSFEEVMSAAYSVSLFTRWQDGPVDQVWLKRRVEEGVPADAPEYWLGARRADGPRHPVPGMSAESCTPQAGLPGPSPLRLPHFRSEYTPSSGDELQSEYFVAREHAVAAFEALYAIREEFAPHLRIAEIRSVAADDLWLSPAYRRDSVAYHFTWLPEPQAVTEALKVIERSLAPFAARPHWGKLFLTGPEALKDLYPHYGHFVRLMTVSDPVGVFRNEFLARCFPV